MKNYSVINMDIVDSRHIQNRKEIQDEIKEILKVTSENFKNKLVAPITLTLGDEWQIVLNDLSYSYLISNYIKNQLYMYNIYCYTGIGIGSISTNISNDTREMDGEAFINARKALNIAKSKNTFHSDFINSKDNKVFFCGKSIPQNNTYDIQPLSEVAVTVENSYSLSLNSLINGYIENNEVIESKITKKQMEIIILYSKYGSYSSITKLKPEFSKSSISQRLNTANYFLIQNNHKIISMLFETYSNLL